MIKEKNQTYIYIYSYHACYIFFLIFKFILFFRGIFKFKFIRIDMLHVLFVLKVESIFEKQKASPKEVKGIVFFICTIDY